jgi:hypothetical protein
LHEIKFAQKKLLCRVFWYCHHAMEILLVNTFSYIVNSIRPTTVVQDWPGFVFIKDVCTRTRKQFYPCCHSLTHSRTPHVFALEAEQDDVRLCHSEWSTALYHQISSETGWNSPQVMCTKWGRDFIMCKCVWLVQQFFRRPRTGHWPTTCSRAADVHKCLKCIDNCS